MRVSCSKYSVHVFIDALDVMWLSKVYENHLAVEHVMEIVAGPRFLTIRLMSIPSLEKCSLQPRRLASKENIFNWTSPSRDTSRARKSLAVRILPLTVCNMWPTLTHITDFLCLKTVKQVAHAEWNFGVLVK